jgi:hypothetical protein
VPVNQNNDLFKELVHLAAAQSGEFSLSSIPCEPNLDITIHSKQQETTKNRLQREQG